MRRVDFHYSTQDVLWFQQNQTRQTVSANMTRRQTKMSATPHPALPPSDKWACRQGTQPPTFNCTLAAHRHPGLDRQERQRMAVDPSCIWIMDVSSQLVIREDQTRTTPSAKYIYTTYKTSTWLFNCFSFSFNLWSMTHRNEFNTSHLAPEVHLWLLIPIWKRWWYWRSWLECRSNGIVWWL